MFDLGSESLKLLCPYRDLFTVSNISKLQDTVNIFQPPIKRDTAKYLITLPLKEDRSGRVSLIYVINTSNGDIWNVYG